VLKGVKKLALWTDWKHGVKSAQNKWTKWTVSSTDRFLKLRPEVIGWEVYDLKEGQGIFIPAKRWHATLNLSCCLSLNVSVCPPSRLLPCLLDAINEKWVV